MANFTPKKLTEALFHNGDFFKSYGQTYSGYVANTFEFSDDYFVKYDNNYIDVFSTEVNQSKYGTTDKQPVKLLYSESIVNPTGTHNHIGTIYGNTFVSMFIPYDMVRDYYELSMPFLDKDIYLRSGTITDDGIIWGDLFKLQSKRYTTPIIYVKDNLILLFYTVRTSANQSDYGGRVSWADVNGFDGNRPNISYGDSYNAWSVASFGNDVYYDCYGIIENNVISISVNNKILNPNVKGTNLFSSSYVYSSKCAIDYSYLAKALIEDDKITLFYNAHMVSTGSSVSSSNSRTYYAVGEYGGEYCLKQEFPIASWQTNSNIEYPVINNIELTTFPNGLALNDTNRYSSPLPAATSIYPQKEYNPKAIYIQGKTKWLDVPIIKSYKYLPTEVSIVPYFVTGPITSTTVPVSIGTTNQLYSYLFLDNGKLQIADNYDASDATNAVECTINFINPEYATEGGSLITTKTYKWLDDGNVCSRDNSLYRSRSRVLGEFVAKRISSLCSYPPLMGNNGGTVDYLCLRNKTAPSNKITVNVPEGVQYQITSIVLGRSPNFEEYMGNMMQYPYVQVKLNGLVVDEINRYNDYYAATSYAVIQQDSDPNFYSSNAPLIVTSEDKLEIEIVPINKQYKLTMYPDMAIIIYGLEVEL